MLFGSRAGFWRRILAFLLDLLIVTVPYELAVMALYVPTNGAIQTTSGIVITRCAFVTTIPGGLEPPPPEHPNFARECRSSLFGLETAHSLTVGRATKQGDVTTSMSYTYTLGVDGRPRNAFSLDWLVVLTFVVYLVAMECRFGATLGKRVLKIRVITRDGLTRRGIPLGRALIRQFAQLIGALPALALALFPVIAAHVWGSERATEMLRDSIESGLHWAWLIVALVLALAWFIWIIVDVARKRDPIYDRIAGTAVVPA